MDWEMNSAQLILDTEYRLKWLTECDSKWLGGPNIHRSS